MSKNEAFPRPISSPETSPAITTPDPTPITALVAPSTPDAPVVVESVPNESPLVRAPEPIADAPCVVVSLTPSGNWTPRKARQCALASAPLCAGADAGLNDVRIAQGPVLTPVVCNAVWTVFFPGGRVLETARDAEVYFVYTTPKSIERQGRMLRFGHATVVSRREFLGLCGSMGLLACTDEVVRKERRPGYAMEGDALALAELVRKGEVSPEELVISAIARIERLDGGINAVTTRLFECAIDRSRGPLPDGPFRGVPFLLKDLEDFEGTVNARGSRLFMDVVSKRSSPHTQRCVDAGLVIVGKSNAPELGLLASTEAGLFGPCRNPWNLSRSSGGSSGGAAASVAAGMLPMAQASDGGGSIRVPSSCCGVFGLKPSRGRNAGDPADLDLDLVEQHVITRSVRDSAKFLSWTERKDSAAPLAAMGFVPGPEPRRLRINFHTRNIYGVEADREVRNAIESAASLCEKLGHRVVEISPCYHGDEFMVHFLNLWFSLPFAQREQARAQGKDPLDLLEPVTLGMAAHFESQPHGAVERAIRLLNGYARSIEVIFQGCDVLLTPVARSPPVQLGTQAGTMPFDRVIGPLLDYASYTPIWNVCGNPAMSVPLGWTTSDLPIGSQFVARIGDERTLFALAYELEGAQSWTDRRPAI